MSTPPTIIIIKHNNNKVKKDEKEMNKKLFFFFFSILVRTGSKMEQYYLHVTKIIRFGISHKGGFLCLVCQMCQIFVI